MSYPISRYLNVRQTYYPSFSADGRFLSFLSQMTGISQAWKIDLKAESDTIPWADQLTFAADQVRGASYSPLRGDNRLRYTHDVGGNENAQIFLLNPETGEEICLTKGYENARHTAGGWSKDGRFMLFSANRRDPGLFDLYLQGIDGAEAKMVWQHNQRGYLWRHVFAPDGRSATVIRVSSYTQNDLFEINLATGTRRQLNPSDKQAQYTAVCYSQDGRSLYVNTDLDADFTYIARLDLETLAWEALMTADWDIEYLTISPNGRYLAYVINRDGVSELERFDLETETTHQAPIPSHVPGVVGMFDEYLTFSSDSNYIAFSYTSATRPSDIYVWDLERDQVRAMTRSATGGIPTNRFIAPKLIRYPTFDGRQIPAWLYPPTDSSEAAPVVVMVHGGPEAQYLPYFNFLAQYFIQNGYAVLAPNVRGSTGYGKSYALLDNVEKRMDSVADMAYAAHWLKAQPEIDGERIALYGGSYGGFMVLAGLTHYPDLWAAAVNIVGISNFVTFLENTSDYRRAHREAEYGSLKDDRDFLESIAPINHLDKIAAPLLVIHGANDPRVPLSEAEQLVAALEKRKMPVDFIVFDDEGHGIRKLKNKLVAYPAIVSFLDQHLKKS